MRFKCLTDVEILSTKFKGKTFLLFVIFEPSSTGSAGWSYATYVPVLLTALQHTRKTEQTTHHWSCQSQHRKTHTFNSLPIIPKGLRGKFTLFYIWAVSSHLRQFFLCQALNFLKLIKIKQTSGLHWDSNQFQNPHQTPCTHISTGKNSHTFAQGCLSMEMSRTDWFVLWNEHFHNLPHVAVIKQNSQLLQQKQNNHLSMFYWCNLLF